MGCQAISNQSHCRSDGATQSSTRRGPAVYRPPDLRARCFGRTCTTLQAEFQDAATRHAPPVELLPFARRVLELSSHAGTLPLQSSLMRLAIDAITQVLPRLLLLLRLPLLLPLLRHRPLRRRRPNRRSLLPPRSNRHSQRNNPRSFPRRRRPRLRPCP
jgi:hypothetical protein